MTTHPLPDGNNAADTIRRLRAIDAEFFGTIYARAGVISGDVLIEGTLTGNDILSSNWDGAIPIDLSAGRDGAATVGYAFDASAGAMQVQVAYLDGAEIENLVAAHITVGQIATGQITDDAITTAKINALAVGATEIASNAVTTAKINADAVTTAKIDGLAVGSAEIASNAVTAVKINADAVTTPKIEDQAVDIQRMLNPVFTTAAGGGASQTTINWDTGARGNKHIETITVPAWVGNLSIFATVTARNVWNKTQILNMEIEIGGVTVDVGTEQIIAGWLNARFNTGTRSVTSPGSTVRVVLRGAVTVQTETSVVSEVAYIAVGVR